MYEITIDALKQCIRPIYFFSLDPRTCHTSILESAGEEDTTLKHCVAAA
jgi:hypothetical protein